MINSLEEVVYVGKAKSLKDRVKSYTYIEGLPNRLKRMVAETVTMEFVTTETEASALLLESSLIKKYKPHYNILLKDDKSFPYIYVSGDHDYPRIASHRGAQKLPGRYFGPYASAGNVYKAINTIYKTFKIRNCSDTNFANRKRPCLQYHIKKCTAPCVGYVSKEEYAEQIAQTHAFLEGKGDDVIAEFATKMEQASQNMDYEAAAGYRDRIRAISNIQTHSVLNPGTIESAHLMAIATMGDMSCIQIFFFRAGQSHGNKPYYIKHDAEMSAEEVLQNFVSQFYENKPVPKEIYTNKLLPEQDLIVEALTQQAKGKVLFQTPQRGAKKKTMDWIEQNAKDTLERHMNEKASQLRLLNKVQEMFGLEKAIERIEVYDNSHVSGTNMVGAMIVAGQEGFEKRAYRKFNIKKAKKSDDFGMMREVLSRRFAKRNQSKNDWPDIVLIDGGKGQLSAVKEVLEEIDVWGEFLVVAISKGPDRHAGREEFHVDNQPSFTMPKNDPVLYYLQRLRDEAHRFAISTHRAKRVKDIHKSPLDGLAGVGDKRKKALLLRFGSAKGVADAGVSDLCQVEGISDAFAQKIYDYFH